jgi:para-nitrobenzyl esterase
MVYLHPGGFTYGSAYELASQDGAQMARHHDVVSVTVNHRLNILGFSTCPCSADQPTPIQ